MTQLDVDDPVIQAAIQEFASIKAGKFDRADRRFVEIAQKYNDQQMDAINCAYYYKYRKSISSFVAELIRDQDTQGLCLAVLAPKHHAWAQSIRASFMDLANNSDLLITSIVTMTPEDLKLTKIQYQLHFHAALEDDYQFYIKGDSFWEQLLRAWLVRDRPGAIQNRYNIDEDAELLEIATKGTGTDYQTYIELFTTTTPQEFREILEQYRKNVSEDFSESLKGEFEPGSLDYYAAALVVESLRGVMQMATFIFNACFTEKNGDKPMLSFLISQFRDRVDLSQVPNAQLRIRKEISMFKASTYLNSILVFFGLKE